MAGTSPEHNTIAPNFASEIRGAVSGRPCKVYMSDVRLRVTPAGLYTYPDVMAVCGEAQFVEDDLETLVNPSMIAEVLSRSTERYDRGDKFDDYRTLPSLMEYILLSQNEVLIERYVRQGEKWVRTEYREIEESLVLDSIGCVIPLREIYAGLAIAGTE